MKTTDPQNELLDVVNSDNQVIGQNTRGEIHRLNQRHRACHMIVFNSRGEVFVQQRSLSKDNSPGLWDSSSAGHVAIAIDRQTTHRLARAADSASSTAAHTP